MSELLKRILFAVPAAVFFLAVMWYDEVAFNFLIIVIGLFTQLEVIKLLRKAGTPTDFLFPLLIGLWVMTYPFTPFSFEIGLSLFVLFIALQTFNSEEESFSNLVSTFFAGLYVPVGLLCLMLIRSVGTEEEGFALALALVLMIWGGDVFAYFGGKNFGKRPLAPKISPNKTIEGFLFGFLGSAIGLTITVYSLPFQSPINFVNGWPLIILIGVFGPVGDLIESKIKRKAGEKDSSNLLPGHGGFFDRFDALILASVAMLIYLRVIQELGYVSF